MPWVKQVSGNTSKRIEQCTLSLTAIQNAMCSNPSSSALHQAEVNYRHQLLDLHWQEEMRAKQQSRIRWLKEGDANTSFFHAAVKARRARNNIRNLDDNGVLINGRTRILQLFMNRFRHLFNQCQATRSIPPGLLHRAISNEDNQMLCALATMEELHSVIKCLNPNRVPGVDGFNGTFYRAAWPIIAEDLLVAVNNFLHVSKLLTQVNHTLLCLVPKKAIPATVDDYRPIAICNVMYRICSKLLANRLKPLLLKLTDLNQTAFISGRCITDSILLAHELYHNLHSKQG